MGKTSGDYERLAFRHAPDATLILADRVILRASLRVEAVFGWTVAELEGQSIRLLYPGQTTQDRTVAGVVDEVIYFGDMTYYDVYLGGTDVEVRLSMRNVPGRPILDVGSQVQVAWNPSALVLFR